MPRHRAAPLGLLTAWLAAAGLGCNLGLCRIELLDVYLPAVITENGEAARIVNLRGGMAPSHLNAAEFEALRRMIVEGSTAYEGAHWGVGAFDDPGSGLGVALPTPFEPGRVVTVDGTVEPPDPFAFTRVGWRPIPLPDGLGRVGLRLTGFEAVSAHGTIEILGVHPLQLRIDVVTADAAGDTVRVEGVMEIVYQRLNADCS